ncbi:complement factor H-related protein 2-like [Mastomys coucha]|uniref:complement factor H-related protein 2-like n=1 Tax=Mastomys coucha TaxID=35658 RepID=UPI001262590F|nr:complement factor H-related protein 2-like [Mastomys coucha]
MGFCTMLLLSHILLTTWLFTAKGEVKPCDFPQFKHGHLYDEERWRPYFPVPIGKQYSYYCENGFSTPSSSYWDYLHCTTQGWEPEVPCLRKCVFHYVENGQSLYWQRIYIEGQSVKVQCHKGYSLPNGQDTMTCTENGWSPPPKCVRINSTVKCGPPPPIDNGDITSLLLPVYAPLSSLEYQCQSFYKIQGSKKITCRNGEWSEPPKCLHPCVLTEKIMERQNIIPKWTGSRKIYIPSEDYVEFVCIPGYQKAQGSPELRAKCIDGHISYPTCSK